MSPRPALVVVLVALLSVCSFVLLVRAESAETALSVVSLPASADCFIDSGRPNENLDGAGVLYVASDINKSTLHTLLRFDLANLGGVHVVSATLHLYPGQSMQGPGNRDVQMANLLNPWEQAKVTWNTRPDTGKPYLQRTVTSTPGWKAWDVTELVLAWLTPGGSNYGLAISPVTTGSWLRSYAERSPQHSLGPYLMVTYTLTTPTPTRTQTRTPTATATRTRTASPSPSATPTATLLPTKTSSSTPTNTRIPTPTATSIQQPTVTQQPTPSPTVTGEPMPVPDLVITDIWLEGTLVCYQVLNQGEGAAPAGHITHLLVQGQLVGQDLIGESLKPGQRLSRCFNYSWACQGQESALQVCADALSTVVELDEGNNCRDESWRCDTTAPRITAGPAVSEITQTTALVCWDTDEASHSMVRYDRRFDLFGSWMQHPSLVTRHCLRLDDLTRDSAYQYRVESCDAAGNCVRSDLGVFRTLPLAENNKPSLTLHIGDTLSGKARIGADAADDQGIRRVEFWLDDQLVHTAWSPPYGLDWETREMLDGPHTWRVRAIDVAGNVTEGERTTQIRNRFDELLSPVHVSFIGLANGQEVWGEVPVEVRVTHDLSSTLLSLQIEVDEVELASWTYPPCGRSSSDPWSRYTPRLPCGRTPLTESSPWNARAEPLHTEHIIEAHAEDQSGNWGHASVRVTVEPPDPVVEVSRMVQRNGTHFDVTISIVNHSETSIRDIVLKDLSLGYQSIGQCSVSIAGEVFRPPSPCPVAYYSQAHTSLITFTYASLAASQGMRVKYSAVPILYTAREAPSEPGIGDLTTLSFAFLGERHELTPVRRWSSSEERAKALHAADYLIMTNPHRFTCPQEDVSKLLSTAAELAMEKSGVLGYLPDDLAARDPHMVRDLIAPGGEWSRQLGPTFTTPHPTSNEAYLLILGETEIVPAFNLDITSWGITWAGGGRTESIKLTDYFYGDVVGADYCPDITVGRILGDSARAMQLPLLSSLETLRGSGFDRTHALAIGGYEDGSGDVFYANARDVAGDLTRRGMSTAIIQWSDWVDGQWTVPFTHYDALTVGDVDGDGVDELIIAQDEDSKIRIIEPLGAEIGHFYSAFTPFDALEAGDVDGDGRDEIIVARNLGESFGVLTVYRGDGTFVADVPVPFREWDDMDVGDVLGDGWAGGEWIDDRGREEIVLISERDDRVRIYRLTDLNHLVQAGSGEWTASVNFTRKDRMRVGNVRSEWPRDEIVVVRDDDQTIYIYDGLGTWLARLGRDVDGDGKTDTRYTPYDGFELADLDGDGLDSIVMMCDDDKKLYLISANSTAGLWSAARKYTRLMGDWFYGTRYTSSETRHDGFAVGTMALGTRPRIVVLRNLDGASSTARLIVPLWDELDRLANRRLGELGGNRSIIAVGGHGNCGGPSPIGTAFSGLWGTFAQHPLVFAFSCLTGNYEDRWCLDYTFGDALMEHGAAVFIGATEVSGRNQNTPAMKGFFESHWDPDTTLAGKAFAQYERLRADDGIRWRFWVVEYNYYGDPKFGAASIPVRAVAETATAAAEQAPPPTTLQVHVPMYQVENADGIDVVSLEGGEWTSEDNRPQVPMYPVVVAVPMGYELQDVQMTSRGSLYSTEGLSLSFNVPITDGGSLDEALVALARAESEGWYPEQAYSWMVRQEGDGSSSLLLTLYPFQYNALTTGVRFYQDMTFSLGYTVPAVTITHLSTDRISYEPGDVVTVSIGLRVSETPTDGYVEAAIYTLAGDYVDGLLVQALPGLTGAAELSPVWNSKGSQAGMYVVRAKVINGAGELQDEDSCSFRLGTVGAEVTLLSAAPNVLTSGQSTYITVQARNTGTTALDGSLTIDVRQGSRVVSSEQRTFTGLGPGLSTSWGVSWSSEGNAPGSYVATGAVRYGGAAHSKSAEITVRGAHSLVLPLVIKR